MPRARDFTFDARVARIVHTHRRLARGSVTHIGPDGLLTVRPRRTSLRFPWSGLALCLVMVLVAKGALFAHLGAETYEEKLSALRSGTGVERIGAWVMTPDWVTMELGARFAPYL